MKVLYQNKEYVFEFEGNVWATMNGTKEALIVANRAEADPYPGRYKDLDRAKAVLHEMFEYYRAGKTTYIMPAE